MAFRKGPYDEDLELAEGDYYEEVDDAEREEELSAEDQAMMESGVVAVREGLKKISVPVQVTTKQIEDALWNYYYDVDQSLAYIKKVYAIKPARNESLASFFNDMPWLKVPKHRQTTFIPPATAMTGGLLGGAPSKLQALASRRKRKAEEKVVPESGLTQKRTVVPGEGDGAAAEAKITPVTQRVQRLSMSENTKPETPLLPPEPAFGNGASPTKEEPRVPGMLVEEPSLFGTAFLNSKCNHVPSAARRRYPIPYMNLAIPSHLPPLFDFSTPSPDDVVLAAQAKAGANKKKSTTPMPTKRAATTKAATASKSEPPTAAVEELKIDDPGRPLSTFKNIDVPREWLLRPSPKKDACFVVVGHVDHGKSTLMGRLLLELGVVTDRTIRKYQKEADALGKSSFAYAWVMDSGSDEREHGVTIDIAVYPFETATTCFTILDAPGHKDFTPNMITGSTYADFAILCVDASTGAFESGMKGQTKQHTLLLRSMGVNRVVVAVNKMDAVSWSRDRYDEIVDQCRGMLRALKFRLDKVSFIPVSGLRGENLVAPPPLTPPPSSKAGAAAAAAAAWYTGPTLIQELETVHFATDKALLQPLRMEIMEISARDFAGDLAVSGRIQQGHLQLGEPVLLQPSGRPAYVRALVANGTSDLDYAVAGQYVRVYLAHVDRVHVQVGDTLCSPKHPVPTVQNFRLKGLAFEPILPSEVEVVRGRLQAKAHIRPVSLLHPRTAEVVKKHPHMVKAGEFGRFNIWIQGGVKVPLESGQRVVIRSGEGTVLAAGLLD